MRKKWAREGVGLFPRQSPVSELPSPSTSQAALLLQLPHLPADADPSGEGIHGDTVPMLGREGAQQGWGGWAGGQGRDWVGGGGGYPLLSDGPHPCCLPIPTPNLQEFGNWSPVSIFTTLGRILRTAARGSIPVYGWLE